MKIIIGEPYEFLNEDQTPDVPDLDGYVVRPGLHKHGYYITLTEREQKALKLNHYTLVTNFWYSPGDFYEILDPKGNIVDPIYLGKILEKLGI